MPDRLPRPPADPPRSVDAPNALIVCGGGVLWLIALAAVAVESMPSGDAAQGLGMGVVGLLLWVAPLAALALAIGVLLAWRRVGADDRLMTRRNILLLTSGALTLAGVALATCTVFA